MRLSLTLFRHVFVLSLVTTAAVAQPLPGTSVANDAPRVEPSPVFGAKIVDIALTFDAAAEQSLLAAPDTDVPALMMFKDTLGANKSAAVKIHIKGQYSRRGLGNKPAFKVKLVNYRFFGLEHLTLNNMVQDATMLHEALGYQVYEAAGVRVPATGYARVTVNGQAYGLYLNLETPDTHFLKRRFGDDSGILYEGSAGVDLRASDVEKFELHEGEDRDRATLKDLIRSVDAPGDDIFYGAIPRVDTASFLGMMAAEALLGDWDSYYASNNYRIYWNPSVRRWFFIPTGIDQSFNSSAVFGATGLLFQKCLASERCTKDYADTVEDVASRFERLDLPARMDALLSVIDAAAQADPKRPYGRATMTSARNGMRGFIARRPAKVRAALSCMEAGGEASFAACAGAVVVNAALGLCAAASDNETKKESVVNVAPCDGGASQRWRLVARDDAVELTVISSGNCLDVADGSQRDGTELRQRACAGIDSQRFSLRPVAQGTQLVAKHSGKCVAVAPRNPQGAALIHVTCAQDAAQTWHIQRSIYR